MIKVSDLAAKAISANSRTFLSRFLHNGAVISGDVRSVITHKGSCGESTFTPGAIYSSYIDVVIDNCKESLSGKELTYQIGVVIDENTTEWYDIGKYTVHKPSTDVYTTSFTALGRISAKLGMLYKSKLTFPTTIQNILDEISGNTGVSIIATGFDTSGVIENEITGYMYREVLAIIAGIFFAYATEDSAGNIVFANFKNRNIIRTDGDRTSVLPKFADVDTEITGVRVSGGEITVIDPETGDEVYQDQTFVSGNANVAIQNEFMTQDLFDANAGNVIGFTFRPATVSISLGDFRIEPFDSLLVTDSLGVERTVPCMSIIHRFDGGIITEVVAPELQDDDSGTAFKGMFSQAIQRFQHDLISVKNLLAGTVTAEEIKANYATIENLNAANANIQKLQTDKLDASTADLKYATISNLQAAVGRISKLETDSLTAESAVIKALQTDKLDALVADLKYATISNLNAATASIEKLQADKLDASAADLKYATISNLEAAVGRISKLEADSLTAESAVIKNLQTEKLDAASADLKYATISNLNAATGRISKLEADSLTVESAIIKALQTDKLDAETADLKYATISSLNATNANITKLQSEKATVGQLEAVDGKIEDLASKAITTDSLSASVAKLGYATVANLNAAVGRISKLETDSLTAESAVIKSLQTDKLDASSAELKYATISNLNAAVGRISKLETDSLTAESAIIKSLQSDFADIETLIFGSATGTVIQTSFSNAVIARLGNAQIKSAMIDSLSADKITSGSINTNNVSIQSADGSMVIADNTIQIKDGSTVRVQIGKDASGNYSIVICDTDGNVMFNTNGITENAIKSAIIRDGMVATNANISASKLNIDSLFTEINDSTKTIKSTRIYMDDVGQTLDIAYKTAVTAVTNIGNTVNTHGTQISAIQGQITSKVWQQDIDSVKNSLDESIDTLSTQYSTLNQTVSGLNSTVASHTSQIASKADKSTLTTVSNKVTELEQSLDGFKLSVSSTYATKTQVNTLSTRVSQTESSITNQASSITSLGTRMSTVEQTANGLTISLEKTYQKTVSKGEQLITNGNGLMGDNTNFSDWTFDGAIANNSSGSFTKAAGSAGTYITDEYFPVNPTNEYTFSLDAKSAKGVGKLYSMLMFFDADKQQISAGHHIYNASSTTTLAKDLKAGDTTIYLTSTAGWSTTYAYGFYMTIWNYKNSFGYTYPECTYSRNRLTLPKNGNYLNSANLNKTANTITLTTAYSGATIPAGTKVSQGGDGATYKYFPCSNTVIPTVWTSYSGKISGVDYSGQNKANTFPPGTAYAKLGFLWNYQGSGNGEQIWVTNLSVTDTTAASQAKAAADNAQSTADTAVSNAATAQNTANNAQSTATTANNTANTARTEAAAAQTAANNAAKTATNYLKFDSSGLLVGDMTASTLGKNMLIYSGGVNIRDNTTVLASFTASEIHLGKNSDSALIYLCNAAGKIYVDKSNELYGFLTLESSSINLKGEALRLSSAKTNVSSTGHLIAITDSEGSYVSVAAQNSGGIAGAANVKFNVSPNHKDGSIVFTIESQSNGTQTLSLLKTNGLVLEKTDIFFKGGTQASAKGIKWDAINSKNPYIGYATDQVDGTFVWSITGTNYASGLAIGGGSGNLLYKGNNVLNAGNYTSYAPPKNHASADPGYGLGTNAKYGHVMLSDSTSSNFYVEAGYAATPAAVKAAYDKANHSHPYLSTSGGTITGTSGDTPLYVRSASTGTYIGIQNSSGTTLGYFGFSAANTPVVYIGSAKKILHEGNYTSYCATAGHTHSYLPLTGGTISGATTFSENVTFTKNIETKVAQVYALEISHATPFIDFHFGNSTADYTSRIIENSKGALTVSGTISQTSDRRLKENIMPLGIPQLMPVDGGTVETDLHSELFDRLKPVQYNFINGNGKICYGLIAQDVVAAMHEVGIEENSLDLVHHNFWTEKTGKEKEQYSVSYNSLIALLIHEVQKLKSELNILKGEQLC